MLEILRRVVQEVNAAQDLNSALDIIVDRVQSTMNTEVCSIYLLDETQSRYVFLANRGLNANSIGKVSLALDEGLVGLVGQRAEPVNLNRAASHPQFKFIEALGEDAFSAFLGVPIIHQRKVLGIIVVQQVKSRRYDESEEAFLITLSAQLAGVIAHARAIGSLTLTTSTQKLPNGRFTGMAGSPGVALGTSVVIFPEADIHSVPERSTSDVIGEIYAFRTAVNETIKEIKTMSHKLAERLRPEELALFDAYIHILDDDALTGEVISFIESGIWAQSALRRVIESHMSAFASMEDAYMRERGMDILDLGQRVLAKLQSHVERKPSYPRKTILIAEELTPAMLVEVPRSKLQALVSCKGSSNSHVAILAKSLGVPAVFGVEGLSLTLLEAKPLIVDGFEGTVIAYPNREQQAYYKKIIKEEKEFVEGLDALKDEPAQTKDGHQIRLWVNTGLITDVAKSLDRGAEGVGLYRTEVHFMMNDRFPTEEEQRIIYRKHLQAFAPRHVTMRTLDIGGDKALSYFPIKEDNPFLGWRGIRVTLDHPEIFLAQVRAMIRANEGINAPLRIMLPMISSIGEVDEAKQLITQCYREITEEGVAVAMPEVGVMIEVPAAVYQAQDIIKRVDFLAVGSNDLIQYMLAVDRNNTRVAELYQAFHPAVLHALKQVADAARAERKPAGVCGEMAANPSVALLLTAMGFDVLSMDSINLLTIKWVIRSFSMRVARKILHQVLKMDNAQRIRHHVETEMIKAGLSQLVRRKGS